MICFAGYVLRLCPFEDVAMVGLAADDVEAFLQVILAVPKKFNVSIAHSMAVPKKIQCIFSVCGGEVWNLECHGDPANKVHGADRSGAKCAGDLIHN